MGNPGRNDERLPGFVGSVRLPILRGGDRAFEDVADHFTRMRMTVGRHVRQELRHTGDHLAAGNRDIASLEVDTWDALRMTGHASQGDEYERRERGSLHRALLLGF